MAVFQRLNEAGKAKVRRERRKDAAHPGVANKRRPGTYKCRWRDAYRVPMSDGRAEDWAAYLRRMTTRPGWSVARLARESHIHRATIFKWISGKEGVTVASVRAIANALGDDVNTALRAAGSSDQPEPTPYSDEEVRKILDRDDLTEEIKLEFVRWALRRREEDRRRREAEMQDMIELLRRRNDGAA